MQKNRSNMTDDQLKNEAKGKFKNGRMTRSARAAQEELWDRFHWKISEKPYVDDGITDRKIEDVQYNG